MVFGVFLGLVALEAFWSKRKQLGFYNGKETAANFAIVFGTNIMKLVATGWQLFILGLAYQVTPLRLPDSIWSFVAAFFLVDFFYYWYHRSMHEFKPLWAFHLVHHSSPWMNLTTSFRLNWFSPFISPFFYVPVVLLGVNPNYILVVFLLNLFYQFWLHTQVIGKLGFLEGIVNTPSAHRVHHGSNKIYLDKNYGGFLMIWDRLFGTYIEESEDVVYGVTTGFMGHNPVKHIFAGFLDLFRGRMSYKG